MKKTILLFGTVALLIIMVSCGQRAQNRNAAGAGDMDCGKLMMEEIFIGLPESVMPKYLKTKEQRNEADVFAAHRERNMDVYVPFEDNHLMNNNFLGDGNYDQWEMAVYYLADDDSKTVVIVQYESGLDAFTLQSDKTLLYDFKTKIFAEIERSIDPVTVDDGKKLTPAQIEKEFLDSDTGAFSLYQSIINL